MTREGQDPNARWAVRRIYLVAPFFLLGLAACAPTAPSDDAGAGVRVDGGSPDAAVVGDGAPPDTGPPAPPAMEAALDGTRLTFEMFGAVSHTLGRTVEFTAAADASGYPWINGTLAFEPDGTLAPCGVTMGVEEPSVMMVRPSSMGGLFGAPDGLSPRSVCEYDVVVRPRCPDDILVLRFSADLLRGAETLTIRDGFLSVPVEFLLHGEPAPDGC